MDVDKVLTSYLRYAGWLWSGAFALWFVRTGDPYALVLALLFGNEAARNRDGWSV